MEATAEVRVSAELQLTGRKTAPGRALCGYATVTDRVRVAAALLASRMARGRLASPLTAREVYRERLDLMEPRVVGGAAMSAGPRLDFGRKVIVRTVAPHRAVPVHPRVAVPARAVRGFGGFVGESPRRDSAHI